MGVLEVENLSVRYGSAVIVDHVSFSLTPGQWLMIAGPNGAGKSTILNAITQGAPYTGTIRVLGQDVKTMKAAQRARTVGVLAQNHAVGYEFTVEEIVRLGRYAHSRGMLAGTTDADDAAVEDALERTGLKSLRHSSALTLSGGELQRTFLAQVLAQQPKVLLLDEPTNHLDLQYQKQIFSLIAQWLREPDRAVVSVVHDLSLARAYGTEAMLLHQGKRIALGPVEQVLTGANLNPIYEMDVPRWMKKMLAQWEE